MFGLSWVEQHGALTHFPIAFLLGAFAFEIGAPLFRKPEWRMVSFWLLVGTVVTAVPTLFTGWFAGGDLYKGGQPPEMFLQHRLFAFISAGLAAVLLILRVAKRDKLTGASLGLSFVLLFLAVGAVSYTGFLGGRMVFGSGDSGSESAPEKPSAVPAKVPQVSATVIAAGEKVYAANGCSNCHQMNGNGGRNAPNLTHEARRHADIDWQAEHLKDPAKMKPGSDMPAYAELKDADLKALAGYLATRK